MTRTSHRIRKAMKAIVFSAAAALVVVPLAQARDNAVDDWFRPAQMAHPQPSARLGDLTGDFMFQQYFRDAAKANDHVLDVSARDSVLAPATPSGDHILDVSARDTLQAPSSELDLRGDYMFQNYFRDAAKANDHILDVSARDAALVPATDASATSVASDPTDGTDWGEIGVGIALALGGALLLVVLVAVGIEVRHSRHRLRSV